MPTNAKTPATYGDFWAFVKGTDGKVKIYNAALLQVLVCVLASAKPTGDGHETSFFETRKSSTTRNRNLRMDFEQDFQWRKYFRCFKFGVTFDQTTTYLSDYAGVNSTELRFWNGDANSDQGYNCYVRRSRYCEFNR